MKFDRGPADLKPTNSFADATLKQMSPDGFFDSRKRQMLRFGSPVHDSFYKGHVGDGESPSKLLQSLTEFALQSKKLETTRGNFLWIKFFQLLISKGLISF